MKLKVFSAILFFALELALVPLGAMAQSTDYTAEVLTKGAGARPLAMGGAFVAAANDATAAYWNPAGLALVENIEITTMHAFQSDIQSYDFLNAAINTHSAGAYALSYLRLGTDGIPHTDSSGPGILDTLQYADQAGLISGGWRIGKQFMVGATVKVLKTDAGTASAFGFGSDIGALYKPFKELTVGITARDITGGSHITWTGTATNPTQTLQPSVTAGFSYTQELGDRIPANNGTMDIPQGTLEVNFDVDTLYGGKSLNNYHLGIEYWYKQLVALRGGVEAKGFQFDSDSLTPSIGVGIWAYLLEVDYAFVSTPVGPLHNVSLITRL